MRERERSGFLFGLLGIVVREKVCGLRLHGLLTRRDEGSPKSQDLVGLIWSFGSYHRKSLHFLLEEINGEKEIIFKRF